MTKTEQQWRDQLTDEEYRVCRQKGTEAPFSGDLLDNEATGHYICTCCGARLFESDTKFDAGCGWPSFFEESPEGNVAYQEDRSHGMIRTEILCQQCDAHLGHVFPDGPPPTGKRYCVNSVSMKFIPTGNES
ncbi:peptide-methionine (R)-S-oxide reductase MsrB [Saliniradius amylolyticus]|nr:peptide-methionine (R)-S-oxide reductase MsrB [Saliniradius amylolyticus]